MLVYPLEFSLGEGCIARPYEKTSCRLRSLLFVYTEKGLKYPRSIGNGTKLPLIHLLAPKYPCHPPLGPNLTTFLTNIHLNLKKKKNVALNH